MFQPTETFHTDLSRRTTERFVAWLRLMGNVVQRDDRNHAGDCVIDQGDEKTRMQHLQG